MRRTESAHATRHATCRSFRGARLRCLVRAKKRDGSANASEREKADTESAMREAAGRTRGLGSAWDLGARTRTRVMLMWYVEPTAMPTRVAWAVRGVAHPSRGAGTVSMATTPSECERSCSEFC